MRAVRVMARVEIFKILPTELCFSVLLVDQNFP